MQVIEPELTMVMALDDSCLACGHPGISAAEQGAGCRWLPQKQRQERDRDWDFFLRNYRR